MSDLRDALRLLRPMLLAVLLVSVGVLGGLLLSTTFHSGEPRSAITGAAPPAEPGPTAAAPGSSSVAAAEAASEPTQSIPRVPAPVPEVLIAPADTGRVPLASPFRAVARRVVPAVVSIESRRMVRHPKVTGPPADLFRKMFPDQDEEGGEIEVPSSGSGFVIDTTGYVLTNDHVVSGSEELTVHLADGRTYEARLIGSDPLTDVGVVKLDVPAGDPPLPTLPLGDSDEIRVGDWAIAVGNPLGELEGTVTVGVVSAKGRKDLHIVGGGPVYQDFIQTDASINFGNSGGPLVNARGEAIGINSAVNPTGQGLGFAIPINMARKVAIELIRTGTVHRGYLGILPQEVTDEIREGWDMPHLEGILVGSVEDDTPAARAGLEVGDVITRFQDEPVSDVPDFRAKVAEAGIGVEVPIRLLRDGKEVELSVVLAERPDTPKPPVASSGRQRDWFGAEIEDVDPHWVEELKLDVEKGVVVTRVRAGEAADQAGLEVGDVILEVNRVEVGEKSEAQRELDRARDAGKPAVVLVRRGGTTTYVTVHAPAGTR